MWLADALVHSPNRGTRVRSSDTTLTGARAPLLSVSLLVAKSILSRGGTLSPVKAAQHCSALTLKITKFAKRPQRSGEIW
jgi:hypothetical protein